MLTARAIEEAITSLDGIVDLVSAGVVVDLVQQQPLATTAARLAGEVAARTFHRPKPTRGISRPLFSLMVDMMRRSKLLVLGFRKVVY